LIAEFLSAQDFRVEAVHTGPRGLARAIGGGYDLVLLDVMLPVLDGFTFFSGSANGPWCR
jgi:two-component system response regulator CpxR